MRSLIDMLAATSRESGVSTADIVGTSHRRLYVQARRDFARAAHTEGYALVDIGQILGGRCHSTISRLVVARPTAAAPIV